jgi:hypothetical protein
LSQGTTTWLLNSHADAFAKLDQAGKEEEPLTGVVEETMQREGQRTRLSIKKRNNGTVKKESKTEAAL